MSNASSTSAAAALARCFEKQGLRCSDDTPTPQLWCSLCTTHLTEHPPVAHQADNTSVDGEVSSPHAAPRRSRSDGLNSSSAAPQSSPLVTLAATKDAVLAHCATRLHLRLYERHTQGNLRQWCPVELHGYRMLLDHHCVYPARMFGVGRLLMDYTISGGMLLGLDVCGGVKLWPQHRYVAVELVLPSAHSGVREVVAPPEEPEEAVESSDDDSTGTPARKRVRQEGQPVQLLHEGSEIPAEAASAHHSREADDDDRATAKGSRPPRRWKSFSRHDLPRYFDERHALRSVDVMEGTLTTVLDVTNASIASEARLHELRRRYSIEHNYADSTVAEAERRT